MEREELNALLRCCDKGQKGYIATSKFIEQLYSLASESEGEVILRRLAKTLSHSDTNLALELKRSDSSGTGRLDKQTFKRCLKQLSIALSDSEIQKLMPNEAPAAGSPSKKTDQGWIDIKKFSLQVIEAGKVKPLPNYVLQGPKGGARGGRAGPGAGNPLGAFEAEKKYKKNLEALK